MSETRDPFVEEGIWLRCGLHAHTTNSDGELAPELLVNHYEWAGYDVLAITDHWVRTDEPSTDRLLVIPSSELNAQAGGPAEDVHVLALGITADPVLPADEFASLEETVAWILAHDGVPYIAHTYWSGVRTEQFEDCEGLVGLEVWNAGCQLELGRGDATQQWDEALERGRLLFGLVADDSHHPGFDSAFSWVWAKARERSREAVLDALRTGAFYGSTGPEIRGVEVDERTVVVALLPGGERDVVRRAPPRRPRERRPARIPARGAGARGERRRPDHGGRASPAAAGAVRARRGRGRRRPACVDEPAVDLTRSDALTALGEREYDLLVVGGGIVGAGVASLAARHGLAVALVDRGDFGGATSSSSSKLIHGGLRYLRLGDVRLVREAHEERRHLMNVVAPHLVHQIPFLLPLYEQGPYRPYVVQTGIAVYSTLARARLNGLVEPARAQPHGPGPPPRRAAEMRPLCRLLDERQPPDPGQRPGGGRVGGDGRQLRGGRRAPARGGPRRGRGGRGGRRGRSRCAHGPSSTPRGRGSTPCAGSRTPQPAGRSGSARACTCCSTRSAAGRLP